MAEISSGWGIGVRVGTGVDVRVCVGVNVGEGVAVAVGTTVGGRGDAGAVPPHDPINMENMIIVNQ
jgi:tetrahydrodipicolinate N-succinyltransferase